MGQKKTRLLKAGHLTFKEVKMILEQIENNHKLFSSFQKSESYDDELSLPEYVATAVHCVSSGNLFWVRNKYDCVAPRSTPARSGINSLSSTSSRRMQRYLRECKSEYCTFITLTYPSGFGYSGGSAKRDLKVFMQRIKRVPGGVRGITGKKLEEGSLSLFWFMEFQSRGAIHYHIFSNAWHSKDDVARDWFEIVGSESEYHLRCGTKVERIRLGKKGIASYCRKYASKSEQKQVPEGFGWCGRFWGVVGCRDVESADISVSQASLDVKPCLMSLKKIDDFIEDAVFTGRARYSKIESDTMSMVIFNEAVDVKKLRELMNFFTIRQTIAGIYDYYGGEEIEELLEDISL